LLVRNQINGYTNTQTYTSVCVNLSETSQHTHTLKVCQRSRNVLYIAVSWWGWVCRKPLCMNWWMHCMVVMTLLMCLLQLVVEYFILLSPKFFYMQHKMVLQTWDLSLSLRNFRALQQCILMLQQFSSSYVMWYVPKGFYSIMSFLW
jgi:hypothetical protein